MHSGRLRKKMKHCNLLESYLQSSGVELQSGQKIIRSIQGYGSNVMAQRKATIRLVQGCETRGCGDGRQVLESRKCRCQRQIWACKKSSLLYKAAIRIRVQGAKNSEINFLLRVEKVISRPTFACAAQSILLIFGNIFSDWTDSIAYGVDHGRSSSVCPILPSRCRSQSRRW